MPPPALRFCHNWSFFAEAPLPPLSCRILRKSLFGEPPSPFGALRQLCIAPIYLKVIKTSIFHYSNILELLFLMYTNLFYSLNFFPMWQLGFISV